MSKHPGLLIILTFSSFELLDVPVYPQTVLRGMCFSAGQSDSAAKQCPQNLLVRA